MNQLVPRQLPLFRSRHLAVTCSFLRMALLSSALLFFGAPVAVANEIGFVEKFALADDRTTALQQLIPGTEDYYLYSCLHAQHTGKFQEVERLLADWIKHHGETQRAKQIKTRQMLLRYDEHPQETLQYLQRELDLHFDHQRDRSGDDPQLPTALDQETISREALLQRAQRQQKNTDGFTPHAFDWLVSEPLNPIQRRHLLRRLTRPDYPGLVRLIIGDLKQKDSGGFGSLEIHKMLLREQLDECLAQEPLLLHQPPFVWTYLRKLAPSDDVDWQYDREAALAYLKRAWDFVRRLDPAFNSLKAHVLYRRLVLDRAAGGYDKSRFMEYLKLPRNASYINPRFMKLPESRSYAADLNYDPHGATLLPPIGNDEPLVRSYLQHFFAKEANYKQYEPFIDNTYLKSLFAETKITLGIGDASRWYAMLGPSEVQALKDRIDLEFAATNPTVFGVDDEVRLDLHVKNVNKLIVKVFRINTENYYRQQGRAVNTDIELDGLVANEELSFQYDEPSERRVLRSFSFPQLKGRGVYVIDFIGNGMSSRAVVRKGALRYLVRTGAAGQVFTVLNEANEPVNNATIWIGGQEFGSQEDGTIIVPFSTKPGRQPLVISHEDFAALHQIDHEGEQYELKVAFYVDRESLIKHREAAIVVRPRLLVNSAPIGLGALENVRLQIASIDHDGTITSKEVPDFQLHEDQESTCIIQVPARLNRLTLKLSAEVEQLTLNKKVALRAVHELTINEIDKTPRTEDIHFLKSGETYLLEVLGRSGEARPKRPVRIEVQHRDFRETVKATLQSDDQGQISLGALEDIHWIQVTGMDGAKHQWRLPADEMAHYQTLHGIAGEPLRIPYAGSKPTRADLSLLSTHHGTPVADTFEMVEWERGFLELVGLAAGDYQLTFKRDNSKIHVRMTDGSVGQRHALSETRLLEIRNANPLQIESTDTHDNQLTVRLAGITKTTRVHIFATRYQPAFGPFASFSAIRDAEPMSYTVPAVLAQYVAGRDIGEEYRYVLDRKYAEKLPGNMLKRPSLLLNPWAIRDTQTGQQMAAEGAEFAPSATAPTSKMEVRPGGSLEVMSPDNSTNLDFLHEASAVLVNLRPDKNGVVSVAMDKLAPHQHLHVVAVDPQSTAYRQVAVPAKALKTNDLRLILALAPDKHYAQRKQVSVLKSGESLVIPDVTTAEFDYYDSLSRLYRLYVTLSKNENLAKFGFVTHWSTLSPEQKREKYSEFACHELNYFLLKKDPDFFNKNVLTYLANKKDKTYLDQWLLNEPLDNYLDPWQYSRLNIVERILLGQRIEQERDPMRRHVGELFDLVPRDLSRLNQLFKSAVHGRALDRSDQLQLGVQLRRAEREVAARERFQAGGRLSGLAGAKVAERGARKRFSKDEAGAEVADGPQDANFFGRAELDEELRESYRRLYVQLERTKEWVENNYYQLPIEKQNADLVRVNAFWNDYAQHDSANDEGNNVCLSPHWAEASSGFTEMMLALGSVDLPFEAQEHKSEFEDAKLTLTAASTMVVFHEQVRELDAGDNAGNDGLSILVSQNFYRQDDRYEVHGGVRRDKFVTDEFLVHTVYGCQTVITNPTSAQIKAEVLMQVPAGAIPVANSLYTNSTTVGLAPYSSKALQYHFYFPVVGQYEHFPVHVSHDDGLLGFAKPVTLKVVNRLSKQDTDSWAYVSQFGGDEEVLAFLRERNVHELQLDRIAFRMNNKEFFTRVTDLLRERHAFDPVLWSYSIRHQLVDATGEFLRHSQIVSRVGPSIRSKLVTVEPVDRRSYQHREYWPLVNARAHQLGRSRRILNDRFYSQYHALMQLLVYQPALDQDDLMAVTYYLLLQDRVVEARTFFRRLDSQALQTTIQYDYLAAYLDCFELDPKMARSIVAEYENYPVDRWRKSFEAIGALLDEIDGKTAAKVDPRDRQQDQGQLAASEPSFDVSLDGTELRLDTKNLESVRVNYYLMDLELLFSRNPFMTEFSGQFSHIFPNESRTLKLPSGANVTTVSLPNELHNKNVLIEVAAAGETKSVSYYSNSLLVELSDSYGQLRVTKRQSGKSLPAVYVKVYAEMQDGSVRFFKDGYTDLRGKFDYTSLSTNELDAVRRFSILVMSEAYGAVVRETKPPKQ